MRLIFVAPFLLMIQELKSQTSADQKMEALIGTFEQGYYQFDWPDLSLNFKVNLRKIIDDNRADEQKQFFETISTRLKAIDSHRLSKDLALDYELITFETNLHLERLHLLAKTGQDHDFEALTKLYDFENGPKWYAWLIKKWTGTAMSPEEVMAFGKQEVKRVKARKDALHLNGHKPEALFTSDEARIIDVLKQKRDLIDQFLPELMPACPELPALDIDRGQNTSLAQAPGYYNNNTFYFNLFDKPFDLTDCDWMLIHEGNPGHHFQVNYHNDLKTKAYRRGLQSLGFVEGWAAYTENLGWEMGLYQTAWEEMGKWNWDIIRSVRIVLDVGLNYYGWTDQEALDFWRQYIEGQDDIAQREINRMKRWPAQVLTYKLGEAAILKALQKQKGKLGPGFNLKDFHTTVLSGGPIPVKLIPRLFN